MGSSVRDVLLESCGVPSNERLIPSLAICIDRHLRNPLVAIKCCLLPGLALGSMCLCVDLAKTGRAGLKC